MTKLVLHTDRFIEVWYLCTVWYLAYDDGEEILKRMLAGKLSFLIEAYAKLLFYITTFLLRSLYKDGKTQAFSTDKHDKMVKLSRPFFRVFDAVVSIVGAKTRESYVMTINYDGCRLLIRPFSHLVDILMVSGLWEPYVKDILNRKLEKTDIIVDVGANIGVYAIPLAKRVSNVIAFEPNPKASELLEKSVKLNQLDNVIIIKKAVGDSQKKVLLDPSVPSTVYSNILTLDSSKTRSVFAQVECIDLDTALALEDKVDWLLIDTEGYEVDVLTGARSLLQKFSLKIIIEVHPANVSKVNILLKNQGYSITKLYGTYYYGVKLE
jgi:FkbM family methyltransferase